MSKYRFGTPAGVPPGMYPTSPTHGQTSTIRTNLPAHPGYPPRPIPGSPTPGLTSTFRPNDAAPPPPVNRPTPGRPIPGRPTPGCPTPYYRDVAGCENATANQGLNIDPACVSVPKLCNWTTLPNAIDLTMAGTAGAVAEMTTISPIAQFFDIHAASFVVVNATDCTLNGRALLKSVKYNTRNLEDYDFAGSNRLEGVLLDSAYLFDNGPTSVNWMAGTSGNNQQLTHVFQNICAFPVTIYATFYGNPTDTCPV